MARASKNPEKVGKGGDVVPLRPPTKCPICGKPAVREFYPFSSKRCADIDLNRWFTGSYAIPVVESEPQEEEVEAENGDGEV
jgi:endogenous inhibitor of DNA gyrase (YacG/DUF329 family)